MGGEVQRQKIEEVGREKGEGDGGTGGRKALVYRSRENNSGKNHHSALSYNNLGKEIQQMLKQNEGLWSLGNRIFTGRHSVSCKGKTPLHDLSQVAKLHLLTVGHQTAGALEEMHNTDTHLTRSILAQKY